MNECQTCKHWDRWGPDETGQCRAKPPVIIYELLEIDSDSGAEAYHGSWPVTNDEDWCGEYVEKQREERKYPLIK